MPHSKLATKITITFSVRVLAIALVVFALFTSFAIWGGYQGIAANHNALQQQKQTQQQGHTQRVQDEKDAKAQVDASFCDVVYFFDTSGVKNAPFIEHLRQLHGCLPASAHPVDPKAPKIILTPGTTTPSASSVPGTGSSTSPKASSGSQPQAGGKPTTSPTSPGKPSPSPEPSPTPSKTPVIPLPVILSPVCNILVPILGTCLIN